MSKREGRWQIYVLDLESGTTSQITNHPDDCRFPTWSPDGRYIAFNTLTDEPGDNVGQIWVVDADGTNPRMLTRLDRDGRNGRPAWSPEGTKIVFNSNRDGDYEIYIMDMDGANPQRLTYSARDDYQPDWSE